MTHKLHFLLTILLAFILYFSSQPSFAAGSKNEDAPQIYLNTHSEVHQEMITLGDLFSGVDNPKKLIGKAPSPGQERIFTSSQLFKIARRNNLNWFPYGEEDRAVVRSPSKPFPKELLGETLKDALEKEITHEFSRINVQFNAPRNKFILPKHARPLITVESLNYNQTTGLFRANIRLGSDDGRYHTTLPIRGKAEISVMLPVLKHSIARGETVRQDDFSKKNVSSQWLSRDIVLNPEDVIGKVASRTLSAGVPLLFDQLEKPVLVEKKSLVIITFTLPGLIVTGRGMALEEGKINDMIRVQNIESKKIIEAEVVGVQTVTIKPLSYRPSGV